jgi:hypothetical protein
LILKFHGCQLELAASTPSCNLCGTASGDFEGHVDAGREVVGVCAECVGRLIHGISAYEA